MFSIKMFTLSSTHAERVLLGLFLLCVALLPVSIDARAQSIAGVMQPEAIDAFVRPYVSAEITERPTAPGAHIVIVDREGNVFLRGYGVAGAPGVGREAMDPRRHLFRIASQTKAFTAIGALQLYERGLLDLDDRVNDHLTAFKLREPFGPITIRHLLQHTSAIDDDWTGIARRSQSEHIPLAEVLRQRPPVFRWPPGEVAAYTNRSTMLLGHVLEAVSGMAYEDYIQENILDVLGMKNTTFVLSEQQRKDLAWGTEVTDGGFTEVWVPDTLTRPSGDLMATAEDMGRFVSALLNGGAYEGRRVLKPETARLMLEDCFTIGENLPGQCLGPYVGLSNGVLYHGHGGGHPGYSSRFIVESGRGYALYVGFLSSNVGSNSFYNDFVDHFFPVEQPDLAPAPIDRAAEIVGDYRNTYASFSTYEKAARFLFGGDTRVSTDGDYLLVGDDRFVQVAPLTFRRVNDPDRYIAFHEDKNGRIDFAAPGTSAMWRVPWHEGVLLNRIVFVVLMVALLAYVLTNIVLVRRVFAVALASKAAIGLVTLVAFAWLAAFGVFLGALTGAPFTNIMYGLPKPASVALSAMAAAAVLSVAAGAYWLFTQARARPPVSSWAYHGGAVLALLILAAWCAKWQLI